MGAFEFQGADIGPVGDLNDDCLVGVLDLLIMLGQLGPCAGCPADFNGDGIVGATDVLILLAYWS